MATVSEETVLVMDADAIRKALQRVALEIVEANPDPAGLVIAGIPTRGVEVARRIAAHIREIEGTGPELGVVDVSMPPHRRGSDAPAGGSGRASDGAGR